MKTFKVGDTVTCENFVGTREIASNGVPFTRYNGTKDLYYVITGGGIDLCRSNKLTLVPNPKSVDWV